MQSSCSYFMQERCMNLCTWVIEEENVQICHNRKERLVTHILSELFPQTLSTNCFFLIVLNILFSKTLYRAKVMFVTEIEVS